MSKTDPLTELATWANPLLDKLSAAERRKLAKSLAVELRRSQQARIKAQKNTDGSHYEQRKLRKKAGRIKREAMFAKLRKAKYLQAKSQPEGASVGFFGRVANLARVHQRGLKDRVQRGGPEIQYERRELLGFTDQDRALIQQHLISHLGD